MRMMLVYVDILLLYCSTLRKDRTRYVRTGANTDRLRHEVLQSITNRLKKDLATEPAGGNLSAH